MLNKLIAQEMRATVAQKVSEKKELSLAIGILLIGILGTVILVLLRQEPPKAEQKRAAALVRIKQHEIVGIHCGVIG